jgi:hypothetical protein
MNLKEPGKNENENKNQLKNIKSTSKAQQENLFLLLSYLLAL